MKKIIFIFVLLGFIFLLTCTGEAPSILQIYSQINYYREPDTGRIYQGLSLFINVEDPDSIEDIEAIYLINDREELYWKIQESSLITFENQGETWLGSNKIFAPDFKELSPGNYRVLIIDTAGERDETEIYVPKIQKKSSKLIFPKISFTPDKITLTGEVLELWIYDAREKFITKIIPEEKELPEGYFEAPELKNGSIVYIYSYDDILGTGLVQGPYLIPRD
ncbi:MAG: hypothetical protein KAU17_10830 [Spirochaetales bacterium]|nr:hypothetical protein [Spirochaetales bacterium]